MSFSSPVPEPFLMAALDHVARHVLAAAFFNRREQPRVARRVRSAELGGDHDFLDQPTDDLAFFEVGDLAFCL